MENLVPQADGTFALAFRNYQKVDDDEVKEIFEEYGDVVNIRKSMDALPWVFVRYKTYEEAHNAYKGLKSCTRFDIRVATSGRKIMDKGSDERRAKGEGQDKGVPKVYRERKNFEDQSFHEDADGSPKSKDQYRFLGARSKNFSKNPPKEVSDDDQDGKRNQIQMGARSKYFSKNSHKDVGDDQDSKRNQMQMAGRSRNSLKTSPIEVNDTDLDGKRSRVQKVPLNRRKIPMEETWSDNEDSNVEAAASSLKQLSVHGTARHRKGNSDDGEIDVKSCNEGPPKLVKASEYYGALTLQHPYQSGLASRAVFNEVWMNHPLKKEMELHEVVITNFFAVPYKSDIKRLCSGVTVLHVSIDVTPMNMPYCRVLVPTEEDAEKLYELDGIDFDGSPLYVSSLGYILDELAGEDQ